MAIMLALLGVVTIFRMSTDIFPAIDIPVVSVSIGTWTARLPRHAGVGSP